MINFINKNKKLLLIFILIILFPTLCGLINYFDNKSVIDGFLFGILIEILCLVTGIICYLLFNK